ncbi:MAG: ankyrin repeat domain-containing protein [Synergistaceae bacterium]|nr:ankyrin repeat domain-containing protein [Synergistaceae bacterium]
METETVNIFIEILGLFDDAFNVSQAAKRSRGIESGVSYGDYRMGCELTLLYFLISLGISNDQISDEEMRFLRGYAGICKNLPREITDLILDAPDEDVVQTVRGWRSGHNHIFTNFVSFMTVIEADLAQIGHPSPRGFSKSIYDLIYRAGHIFSAIEGSGAYENKLTLYMNMLRTYIDENSGIVNLLCEKAANNATEPKNVYDAPTFEENFTRLLADYPNFADNPKQFIGLLRDVFPTQRKEANLISFLYEAGIAREIKSAAVLDDIFASRFAKRVEDEYGVSRDSAKWAVSVWCVCYGGEIIGKQCGVTLSASGQKRPAERHKRFGKTGKIDKTGQKVQERVKGAVKGLSPSPSLPLNPQAAQELYDLILNESATPEAISRLIQAGADINAVNALGQTPLMSAATSRNLNAVRALIDAGANVDTADPLGQTPLMLTIRVRYDKNLDVVRALIDAGADVNARDNFGQTPLMLAASEITNPNVVCALIDAGADVDIKDNHGNRAVDFAKWNRNLTGTGAYKLLKRRTYSSA